MVRIPRTMETAFYVPVRQTPFKLLMEIVIGIDSKRMIEGLQQKMDMLGKEKRITREKKINRVSRFFISVISLEFLEPGLTDSTQLFITLYFIFQVF